jgi:WD40 repeat protein
LQRGHTEYVTAVAFSKDGKWLVTAGQGGQAVLWETATGREVRRFEGHKDEINAAVFSEDGKWLTTCSGEGLLELDQAKETVRFVDASACLWNVATGERVRVFKGHNRPVGNGIGTVPFFSGRSWRH